MRTHKLNYNEMTEAFALLSEEEQVRFFHEMESRVFTRKSDFFKLSPEQELEMKQSLKEADNGEFISHEDVVARAKSWFTK